MGLSPGEPVQEPKTGEEGCHHTDESLVHKAVKDAAQRLDLLSEPLFTHCGIRSQRTGICSPVDVL